MKLAERFAKSTNRDGGTENAPRTAERTSSLGDEREERQKQDLQKWVSAYARILDRSSVIYFLSGR